MKKIWLSILAVVMCMVAFSSCSKSLGDPLDLAHFYDDAGYLVSILVDDTGIEEIADEFEISAKGIYCVMVVVPDDGEAVRKTGLFIYCETTEMAEKSAEELEDFIEDNEDFEKNTARGVVEIDKKLVFIGSEETWEKAQEYNKIYI